MTNLGRKMTETGASADRMRKRLEAATKALPKIEIDADSTAAEIKFAELRKKLADLSTKKIGIDVDATDAHMQLAEIERELSLLQGSETDIHVRADIGEALAELRAIDSEVSRLDGKQANVKVDADIGGALGGIAMVGAALAALPALTTIGVGVAALGGAFAAAGAGAAGFGAVAIPALGRVNEALKQSESAAGGAGGAMKSAAQAAAESAQRAMSLEAAEKRVTDAKRTARSAEMDLTQARIEARRAAEELTRSVRAQALSEEDASLSVEEARLRRDEVNADPKATDLERRRAELSYKQAKARLEDEKRQTKELAQEKKNSDAAGIEGSKQVIAAKQKVKAANDGVLTAEKQLNLLMLQQKAAMQQAAGGASSATKKLDDLTKSEKKLYDQMKDFKADYLAWQKELQPDVLPVIGKGLELVASTLPKISPLVRGTADAFSILLDDMKEALAGPFWNEFIYDVGTYAPGAIIGLGRSFGNIVTGLAGVMDAFLPFVPTVVGGVEKATKAFSEWGQGLEDNPQFIEFMTWVKENAPEVWEIIKNIAKALGNVAEAIAPLTLGAFGGLGLLAELVAGMDPGHIQNIAIALAAIKLATMGMAAAKSWQSLAGGIDAVGGASGKARGKVEAFGKAAVGISVAVIGLQAVGSMVTTLDGSSKGIGELTLAMQELGQSGKWAGDLESQWVGAFDATGGAADEFRLGLQDLVDPGWVQQFITHPFTEIGAVLPGLDSSVDRLEQKFSDMDTTLGGMVQAGNLDGANRAFEELKKQAALAGVPVSELEKQFPIYSQAVRVAGNATKEAAEGIATADDKLGDFQKSLDTFAGRTDALQALRNIKGAYDDAKEAIHEANGKLEINASMTDAQRDAVIRAREKFAGYLTSVREGAEAQKNFGKNIFDSTGQVVENLPKMMSLAGKNKEAREQVILLAEAYGISRTDALKAAEGGEALKEVLAKLKSKALRISADTTQADAAIGKIIRTLNKTYVIGVNVRSDQQEHGNRAPNARGNVYPSPGRVVSFAAGSERHVAQIAGPGAMRVWAEPETQGEAYIPLASSKRARSMDILSSVAARFGQQVVPAGGSSSTLMSGSAGLGSAASTTLTVNLDNADEVVVSLDNTTRAMQSGLSSASSTLTSAMGSSGTLTTAVGELGSAASVLGDSLSDAVSDLASEMRSLTSAISSLRSAVSATSTAAASKTSSTSTSAASSKPTTAQAQAAADLIKKNALALLGGTTAAAAALVAKNAAALLAKSQVGYTGSTGGSSGPAPKKKPSTLIQGSGPLDAPGTLIVPMANGGLVNSPRILAGEAGREMVVPLSPDKRARGVATLTAAAGVMGLTVGPKFVSAPQMPRYSRSPGSLSAPSGGVSEAQMATLLRHIERLASRPTIGTVNAPPGISADELAERLNFKADSRG